MHEKPAAGLPPVSVLVLNHICDFSNQTTFITPILLFFLFLEFRLFDFVFLILVFIEV